MSRQVLEQIRDELTSCGVVSSNREFCESWLARDASYLRGLKFRGLEPSAATLTVNRHPIVTPYRRPILTPLGLSWPGAA
ncbi:MAG: hypothetical protein NXI27_31250 [Alphaproteobacteria bacterium]|nr:hypothetical protein [Alphaproteobacteria bacterium]